MAHMIDTTTGRAAIAYTGALPWHGLGQALTPGASIDTWTREAGLDYTVLESSVQYATAATTELQSWPARKVLHRSATPARPWPWSRTDIAWCSRPRSWTFSASLLKLAGSSSKPPAHCQTAAVFGP
jgi:hypothetical protein